MHWWQPNVSGTLPEGRYGHTCTVIENNLVLFGGGDGIREFNQIYYLSMGKIITIEIIISKDTFVWNTVEMDDEDYEITPPPRSFHSATRLGKHLLLFGGMSGTNVLKDLW